MAVKHVVYEQTSYRHPNDCVTGIRQHIDHGWQITEIRGSHDGPYLVVFRLEDVDERLDSPGR